LGRIDTFYDYYGITSGWNMSSQLISETPIAQNISSSSNPSYTLADFTTYFPQFTSLVAGDSSTIPSVLVNKFIEIANTSLDYARYDALWIYCMGLYIAHLCTLFLSASYDSSSIDGVVDSSEPLAVLTSKSVGDVSANYDVNAIGDDLKGFGTWKATTYGQQLATYAKMIGKGGTTAW
jgi:hypothetical protein